ncbi:hypothetical protein EVAR_95344_1 [Eumeta japonica]|uniref:Uncharacterized protein n=1 Tax=Eumeta variegata TaxID=151549 RepID=A0A4C1UAM5_EUMVA|nr:hypothetical protein EVAR_95344_1 [Eumeta japonica]
MELPYQGLVPRSARARAQGLVSPRRVVLYRVRGAYSQRTGPDRTSDVRYSLNKKTGSVLEDLRWVLRQFT